MKVHAQMISSAQILSGVTSDSSELASAFEESLYLTAVIVSAETSSSFFMLPRVFLRLAPGRYYIFD